LFDIPNEISNQYTTTSYFYTHGVYSAVKLCQLVSPATGGFCCSEVLLAVLTATVTLID